MIFNDDIIKLASHNPKRAFVEVVHTLKQGLVASSESRIEFSSQVLGFLMAHPLGVKPPALKRSPGGNMIGFEMFMSELTKIVTQFQFEASAIEAHKQISLATDKKQEIQKLLEKIRKIVNQEIAEGDKKEAIIKKLSALENEVSLDRTSFEALLNKGSKLTKALGEYAENLEPLANLVQKIKNFIWADSEDAKLLDASDETLLLEGEKSFAKD